MSEDVDTLLIDATNLCHIHFHGNKNADDDEYISMTFHTLLYSIKFLYNKFKPSKIVMAFDHTHPSWRKLYTKNLDECVTHVGYKSKRNQKQTPKEKERRQSAASFLRTKDQDKIGCDYAIRDQGWCAVRSERLL